MFLGSNIGNFGPADRLDFLRQLARPAFTAADRLLIGFDLQKDPRLHTGCLRRCRRA